jgi:hypothetical protein
VEYIGTKEKIADIFTKPLPREVFEYLRQKSRWSLCPPTTKALQEENKLEWSYRKSDRHRLMGSNIKYFLLKIRVSPFH